MFTDGGRLSFQALGQRLDVGCTQVPLDQPIHQRLSGTPIEALASAFDCRFKVEREYLASLLKKYSGNRRRVAEVMGCLNLVASETHLSFSSTWPRASARQTEP